MRFSESYSALFGLTEEKYRKMKPTKKHQPVLWENMLGTLYASNPQGEIKYCDYRGQEAFDWAEMENAKDIRIFKNTQSQGYDYQKPRKGQMVVWAIFD